MSDRLKNFLGADIYQLVNDGEKLVASAGGGFRDYSFVVFPFAKAYEGFLKKLFFQIGAISEWQYRNDRWRVGRALNPQLEKDLRHNESVYDRIVEHCGGTPLADAMWHAWKRGRNQIFHFYPEDYRPLTFGEASDIVREITAVMERALGECRTQNDK